MAHIGHLWTFHNRNFSNLSNLSCSIWGLDEGCHGSLPEGGIQLHEIGERPKKDPTKPPPNQNNLTLVTLVPYVPCLVHSVSAKSHFMIFPCYRSFPLPQMYTIHTAPSRSSHSLHLDHPSVSECQLCLTPTSRGCELFKFQDIGRLRRLVTSAELYWQPPHPFHSTVRLLGLWWSGGQLGTRAIPESFEVSDIFSNAFGELLVQSFSLYLFEPMLLWTSHLPGNILSLDFFATAIYVPFKAQ